VLLSSPVANLTDIPIMVIVDSFTAPSRDGVLHTGGDGHTGGGAHPPSITFVGLRIGESSP
jgi:hypothetical protein